MNSGVPTSPVKDSSYNTEERSYEVQTYTVALLGAQGVGKTALISQFMTSECINAYDGQKGMKLHTSKH